MRIDVQITADGRALITYEPSLIARLLYGRQSESELAVFRSTGWFTPRGWVGLQLEAEIDDALERERRAIPRVRPPPLPL